MAAMQYSVAEACKYVIDRVIATPPIILFGVASCLLTLLCIAAYIFISYVAPRPRPSESSEKFYTTVETDGTISDPLPLPCWQDDSIKRAKGRRPESGGVVHLDIDLPSVFLSVVVPAYNEEDRIVGMLEEAVNYLEQQYGSQFAPDSPVVSNGLGSKATGSNGAAILASRPSSPVRGWEIVIVSDGSTDSTLSTVHSFTKSHLLPARPRRLSGPWTHHGPASVNITPSSVRVVSLNRNRGKGGAVTHGLRHVRGKYCIFADADGASKFTDLGALVSAAQKVEDAQGRVVVVGSRAHLVGTSAVVQRSKLRNFLMYSFHTLLSLLTPPKTARIKDTQCGFKLFSRNALPDIVPYMHSEGWIFDVEMLMLAESANIPVAEVPIGWREVGGSKLNVLRDSLGMAWGLALLRICWMIGIYRKGVLPEGGPKHNAPVKKDV